MSSLRARAQNSQNQVIQFRIPTSRDKCPGKEDQIPGWSQFKSGVVYLIYYLRFYLGIKLRS